MCFYQFFFFIVLIDGSTSDNDPASKTKTEHLNSSKTETVTAIPATEDLNSSITSTINQSISVDETSIVDDDECTKSLDQINPDIMKSIDSIDVISVDNSANSNASNADSLAVPDSSQGGESDQESKNELNATKSSDAGLGDLKDHGVVSLHYPEEEDGRGLNCFDSEESDKVNCFCLLLFNLVYHTQILDY